MRFVVKEPATLVGQATIAMPVLAASRQLGELANSVVLLSPSGVNVLSESPTLKQTLFGKYLRLRENKLNDFYLNQLLTDDNIYGSVANGLYDKSLVDETFLTQFKLGRNYLDQKWISLSFIEGRLSYKFSKASHGVTKPVLMIFGKEDVGIAISDGAGSINNMEPDRESDFAAIRPDFSYLTLPNTASILWEEKANLVSDEILKF
jgi:pimeloyl-ACP methyl ester carboxylesterase